MGAECLKPADTQASFSLAESLLGETCAHLSSGDLLHATHDHVRPGARRRLLTTVGALEVPRAGPAACAPPPHSQPRGGAAGRCPASEAQLYGDEQVYYRALLGDSQEVAPGIFEVTGFAKAKQEGTRMMAAGWLQATKMIYDGSTDAGLPSYCAELGHGIRSLNKIKHDGDRVTKQQLADFLSVDQMVMALMDARAGKVFPPPPQPAPAHTTYIRSPGVSVACDEAGVREVTANLCTGNSLIRHTRQPTQ